MTLQSSIQKVLDVFISLCNSAKW